MQVAHCDIVLFLFSGSERKPEKLETFNESPKESDKSSPSEGEQEVLASADKYPNPLLKKTATSLKPGQRFFILNGQPLFSNYPFQPYSNERVELKPTLSAQSNQEFPLYRQDEFLPQSFEQFPSFGQPQTSGLPTLGQTALPNYFLRNAVTGQISDVNGNYAGKSDFSAQLPQNFVSLNQPQDFKDGYLRNAFAAPELQQYQDTYPGFSFGRTTQGAEAEKVDSRFGAEALQGYGSPYQISGNGQKLPLSYFQYETGKPNAENDDSVVIDAKSSQNDKNQDNSGTVLT